MQSVWMSRLSFSRADAVLMASSGRAASMSFADGHSWHLITTPSTSRPSPAFAGGDHRPLHVHRTKQVVPFRLGISASTVRSSRFLP